MQASIASLFEVPLTEAPDPFDGADHAWWNRLHDFAVARGVTPVEHRPAVPIVTAGEGMLALLSGIGPRGYRHMVVGRLGYSGWKIAHDPHPEGGGIDPIDYAILFVAADPARNALVNTSLDEESYHRVAEAASDFREDQSRLDQAPEVDDLRPTD